MKVTLENTSKIVEIVEQKTGHAIPARIWEGETESGIKVQALITRIAPLADPTTADLGQFESELQEAPAPSAEIQAFPLRLIL